jgi:enoyl-[acyl-carrier protein] reductase II
MASEEVDVIIASGHEAERHVGRIGTAVLVPQVVDAVDVPVVAAGGLVDGRGLVAALAFGAVGVWMGTRFVATREAYAHDNYKNKIVEINEEGTVVTRAHSGKPCRLIRNKFTQEWEGREAEIEPFPRQFIKVGQPASVRGRVEGDIEHGSLPCGQGTGGIHEVKSAGEVVLDIVDEARSALEVLCRVGR